MSPSAPISDAEKAKLPALHVEGLTKRYGKAGEGSDRAVTAVDGLGFTLPPGETMALLGGNGAGKTTTLAMLLGLLVPTAGRIEIFGEDVPRHRSRVQHLLNFSSPYVDLPHKLSVRENLDVYAGLYGMYGRAARAWRDELYAKLQLENLLTRDYGALSAGQKTRVSLAKALVNRPRLLLLDEPTASLDPDTADWVRTMLIAYQAETGASIRLASHNMPEVERMAQHVLMMRQGRLVDQGSPEALLARYGRANLEDVFLDIARNRRGPDAAA